MNRQDAAGLIQRYKDFPFTQVFGIQPYNYPLFHLMECYAKGWRIDRFVRHTYGWAIDRVRDDDIPFEQLAYQIKNGVNEVWGMVAKNPHVTNPAYGFVQEDLYSRYVGKCNPLKTPRTTWNYTPVEAIQQNGRFRGTIGRHTPLYLLEIDLDTTDIVGERNEKIPWHYLQQTINWKPFTDRIDWNNNQQPQ